MGIDRNHVPWSVIGLCYIACPLIMLTIRRMLAAENDRRKLEPPDETYNEVYIEVVDKDGGHARRRVDKVRLHTMIFSSFPVIC